MKNLLFLFIAASLSIGVYAAKVVPTAEDLKKFKETKTLIVLENNPLLEFNSKIQKIIKENWDITEFEFIKSDEFEEKRKNPEYSFIVITTNKFPRDKVSTKYKFVTVLLGKKVKRLADNPELISFPLAYDNAEEETYIYKLGAVINFIQTHLKMAEKDPSILSSKKFKYIKQIKNKEIWVTEKELYRDLRKEKNLSAVYPHKIKITTAEEIDKAIAEQNPDVIVMHKVGPEGSKYRGRCYKSIFDANGEKMYYYKVYKIKDKPDAWINKEFKKFAK